MKKSNKNIIIIAILLLIAIAISTIPNQTNKVDDSSLENDVKTFQNMLKTNTSNETQEKNKTEADVNIILDEYDAYKKEINTCILNINRNINAEKYFKAREVNEECSNISVDFYQKIKDNYSNSEYYNPIKINIEADISNTGLYSATINYNEDLKDKKDVSSLILVIIDKYEDWFYSQIKIREEYPYFYSLYHNIEKNEKIYEEYSNLNQELNNQNKEKYEYAAYANYFLQINPIDSSVKYIVEQITRPLNNEEDKKWIIFSYIRDNIEYKSDPNWKADWVYSPSYTLITKNGDCDDHAVLLASMFMQAGLNKVGLCFTKNHAYTWLDGIRWDATCKSCIDISALDDDYYENPKCYEINEYLTYLKDIT